VEVLVVEKLKRQNNKIWTLITIDDPSFLKSKSIFDLIQIILKNINFKFIIFDGIYGAFASSLTEKENIPLDINKSLEEIIRVQSFEWGDFFLFKEYPKSWSNPKGQLYPYVVAQSDTTIRAVDNQYMYIYTYYQEIIDAIQKNYNIESIKSDLLENLDFPE
jgi:hypothetical protein